MQITSCLIIALAAAVVATAASSPISVVTGAASYAQNSLRVWKHNRAFGQGKQSFAVKLNQFGSLSESQIESQLTGFSQVQQEVLDKSKPFPYIWEKQLNNLDGKNWVELGAVGPVRDQRNRSSDWAEAAVGAVEGHYFRKYGKLPALSVQQVLDCTPRIEGSNGGVMQSAFQYAKKAGGLSTMATYPDAAQAQECPRSLEDKEKVDIEGGFKALYKFDEYELMITVTNKGPVAVAIEATWSFMFYSSGVYYEPACTGKKANHAVLVVGYGKDDKTGEEYWLVKNSWGTQWGENGYIRMAMLRENNCCIACYGMYPTV